MATDGRKIMASEVLPFLEEIGEQLEREGLTATIYIGGGAAIALRFGEQARSLTDDIDGLFQKNEAVTRAAASIAEREGLQSDWVNDRFAGFVPGAEDVNAREFRVGGLTVRVASSEFLLAMKINAARPKDLEDTLLLIRELGLTRARDIADLTTRLYGDATVPSVEWDDCLLHSRAVLRVVRSRDPSWPADPDDPPSGNATAAPPKNAVNPPLQGRRPAGAAGGAGGQFTSRTNSPPEDELH